MAILSWPTLSTLARVQQFEFGLRSNTQTHTSPLSNAVQTLELPAPRWIVSFSLENIQEDDAAVMQAWFAQMRGQSGRFYLHNMARQRPRGVATGTPLVNGASQTGVTLATDGWTPSQTGILKAGDFFGVNGELKMCVADCDSNGSGQATITFEPPLRASPADNAAITTTRPTATFKLDDDTSKWRTRAPLLTTFNITATEAW